MTGPGGLPIDVPDIDNTVDEIIEILLQARKMSARVFLGLLIEDNVDPNDILEELAYEIAERGYKLKIDIDNDIVEIVEQ